MTVKDLAIIVLSSLCLAACQNKTIYSEYQSVDINAWHMDSVLRFEVPITDTMGTYNVLLHVRHTDAYPYQNMWLFVEDNMSLDTIEFYLANDRGEWLGNGHSLMEMPILYRERIHLTDSTYSITIQQAMREERLRGIADIGVEMVKGER